LDRGRRDRPAWAGFFSSRYGSATTSVRVTGVRVILWATAWLTALPSAASVPHLRQQGSTQQLIVNDAPFLVLGGELGNSSASSASYMAPHWSRLKQMHLNTVLAPVSWELIEPAEAHFDFASVDALIREARANDLKLIFLWFGAWKNSMSTYVPAWVKRNESRFPRAQLPNGQGLDILSAFAPATRDADARAFGALLGHLKTVDAQKSTVLMIQVENEIGMLPVARDYSGQAERQFRDPVPDELIQALVAGPATPEPPLRHLWEEHGSKRGAGWSATFGPGDAAAEIFTAWHYARYVEAMVHAGKAAYPLPMYVNAALNRMNKAPGEYPSGGPLPHLLDVWKTGAPSLDLLAPDIYFPNFVDLASRYKRPDNPLFIPEANNADRPEVPANAYYAVGKLDAIGFSPFAIESSDERQPNPLAQAYAVLEQLSPAILAAQGLGRMSGFKPRVLEDQTVLDMPVSETLGGYRFTVSFVDARAGVDPLVARNNQDTASHGGLIIQTGPEDYLVAGQGMIVTFAPVGEGPPLAGIDSVWEGTFDSHGTWVPGRLLNGDQTHQGRHLRLAPGQFQIQRLRLYRYE
jgi:beta-galactosidase GanA